MAYSSYQVQRMVTRLRRARQAAAQALGLGAGGAEAGSEADVSREPARTGFDRVQLSERALAQAAEAAASIRLPPGTPVSPAIVVDDTPLPLPTRIELERRAGSFMRPPLAPYPAPAPIPRIRRGGAAAADAPSPGIATESD
jgi:hypothetical protein